MARDLVLAPADTSGFLAAAALRRRTPLAEVRFLWSRELSRRLAAVADEEEPPRVVVVDLLPVDSVDTLLLPALTTLNERGVRTAWYYGREEAAPALLALSNLADVVYDEGVPAWRLVIGDSDPDFAALAERVIASETAWRTVLKALTTSWDWGRIYAALDRLAALEAPGEKEVSWATAQLVESERAETLVAGAPVREVAETRVAVVSDPAIPARLRPEVFRSARPGVDAIAFAGSTRLIVVTTHEDGDLSFLKTVADDPELTSGRVGGQRADFVWRPGSLPRAVMEAFGAELFGSPDR
jgi:hypothetical protein